MTSVLLMLSLTIPAQDAPKTPRKPSAIAPSLPALTREEERKLDDIIERFMRADTGQLRGLDAKKAVEEFDKLGMEAVPALIRGLNEAAKINHSCPVLMISKKLLKLLNQSDDEILVEFARDEIGASVTRSPHARLLRDIRFRLTLRKNALAQRPPIPPGGPSVMSTMDLVRALNRVKGSALEGLLRELGKRDEKEALTGLTLAARSRVPEVNKLAKEMLDVSLGRQSISAIKELLMEGRDEIKKSAIRVTVDKHIDLVPYVIDQLTDNDRTVRIEAREALRKLGKGEDFGPEDNAPRAQQQEAQRRWKAWWFKKTAEK